MNKLHPVLGEKLAGIYTKDLYLVFTSEIYTRYLFIRVLAHFKMTQNNEDF
jgi:hypothetical protein